LAEQYSLGVRLVAVRSCRSLLVAATNPPLFAPLRGHRPRSLVCGTLGVPNHMPGGCADERTSPFRSPLFISSMGHAEADLPFVTPRLYIQMQISRARGSPVVRAAETAMPKCWRVGASQTPVDHGRIPLPRAAECHGRRTS
jgi:hypothetical protein